MTYAALERAARSCHLVPLGGFHPSPADGLPKDCKTLVLLGPDEPAFWPAFTASPEWRDGQPDPVDRWSARVVGALAHDLGATPLYPFGGPPYKPFYSWALRTGRIHASPVKLLVHDRAGLFVSFRGALALPRKIDLPAAPPPPCDSCADQPCRTACLSSALTPEDYDVPRCQSFLGTPEGAVNLSQGCAVRRACPVSQGWGRLPEQSAYHMQHFKGG
ncbi:MAG: ferredoxin [Sulfitobacter sp.]|nr:ferredoxin [Sulfitobacter sp.]